MTSPRCKLSILTAVLLVLILPPAVAADTAADLQALRLVEISPGVHAALQPAATRFDDCNSLIVVGQDAVLVVDAPAKTEAVTALADLVKGLTDRPVRYLVNTHWHADHTQGNAFLREKWGSQVTVVGHQTLTEDVPARAATSVQERVERLRTIIPQAEEALKKGLGLQGQELTEEQQEQQRQGIDASRAWLDANADTVFLAPTLTYETGLTIHLPPFTVVLRHRPGHTRGDTVLWIPQAKVLATGDLLDDLPYVGHGSPRTWIESLDVVGERPFTQVVPGHGPVFKGREQLEKIQGFLEALLKRAGEVQGAGGALEDLKAKPDMESWRPRFVAEGDAAAGRFFDGVLNEALERAWDDVQGTADAEK